jgi:hypothetical protein
MTENKSCEEYANDGRDQSAYENLATAQAHRNVKVMAQQRGRQHRREDNAEQMPQLDLGRVHYASVTLAQTPSRQ